MPFGKGRKSVIDQKLRDLDQEIALVNRKINTVSRVDSRRVRAGRLAGEEHGIKSASSRLDAEMRSVRKRITAAISARARDMERGVPAGENAPGTQVGAEGGQQGGRDMDEGECPGIGRDKFVNYFAAGHFSELRPAARQDDKVMRNKAVMMAVLALLVAFGLLYHFFLR